MYDLCLFMNSSGKVNPTKKDTLPLTQSLPHGGECTAFKEVRGDGSIPAPAPPHSNTPSDEVILQNPT